MFSYDTRYTGTSISLRFFISQHNRSQPQCFHIYPSLKLCLFIFTHCNIQSLFHLKVFSYFAAQITSPNTTLLTSVAKPKIILRCLCCLRLDHNPYPILCLLKHITSYHSHQFAGTTMVTLVSLLTVRGVCSSILTCQVRAL